MRSSRQTLAAALALAALGAQVGVVSPGTGEREVRAAGNTITQDKVTPTRGAPTTSERAAWLRGGSGLWPRSAYPRPGWTVKQGQRAARKRRNQQRNRRAHKC